MYKFTNVTNVFSASRLALLAFILITSACGASWQAQGTDGVLAAAQANRMADGLVQAEVVIQCPVGDATCLHAHHLDIALQAIQAAKDAILTAAATLRAAITANAIAGWLAVAPCLAATVQDVLNALTDAGVIIPAMLTEVMGAIRGFLGPCLNIVVPT